MQSFPEHLQFKFPWRSYQARILHQLDEFTDDDRLHIIAPPGSGKTVLGLEVARRLNHPTLILAPTLTICHQWVQRFCEDFLNVSAPPPWISTDIHHPQFLTVITYQGLHAAVKNTPSPDEGSLSVVEKLKNLNVQTIILDEAHHLKNSWWETLYTLINDLHPIVVGLTATPPIDSTPAEWARYHALHGPVDAEVFVPEMVKEGNLCPHQDYVYFSLPTVEEQEKLDAFRSVSSRWYQRLQHSPLLKKAIEEQEFWQHPLQHQALLYENITAYSSCIVFMHHQNAVLTQEQLDIIGAPHPTIPTLTPQWLAHLLDFFLIDPHALFDAHKDERKALGQQLRDANILEDEHVDFDHSQTITNRLTTSPGKLQAIVEIVYHEYVQLRSALRLVILTDFIRKEFLPQNDEDDVPLSKMGVVPIFEKLRRELPQTLPMGVLTGSLIIIPNTLEPTLQDAATRQGIGAIETSALFEGNDYRILRPKEKSRAFLIQFLTNAFRQGDLHLLIGTKALLGEGWDAPEINTLILASVVGSFVLSNQMRGRAIRTVHRRPDKSGNIWHLACIDPAIPDGGDDYQKLKRRMESFVGLSNAPHPTIENGVERLGICAHWEHDDDTRRENERMFALARERNELATRWQHAEDVGETLTQEVRIHYGETAPPYEKTKRLHFVHTIRNAMLTLVSALLTFAEGAFHLAWQHRGLFQSWSAVRYVLIAFSLFLVFRFGRQTVKTFALYLRYRDIAKDFEAVGRVLLDALVELEQLDDHSQALSLKTDTLKDGTVTCYLRGANRREQELFMLAFQEILEPIQSPRYLIIRNSRRWRTFLQKDYHAVPEVLGRNKRTADVFQTYWEKHVGPCDLVFTQNLDGRKVLLRARLTSLSAQFQERTERITVWH